MTRAIAYYRRSKEYDPTEPGVAQQKEQVDRYAAMLGYQVVAEYHDSDKSAWSGSVVERPDFDRMVAELDSTQPEVILAWRQNRLARNTQGYSHLREVAKRRGVHRFEFIQGGAEKLGDATSKFTGTIMAATDEKYSDDLSADAKRGHAALASRGDQNGGRRTFGFKAIPTPHGTYRSRRTNDLDPVEVALIKEAAQRVVDGEALRAIARDWNERGVPTVTGKTGPGAWNPSVIRTILTNPKVNGRREVGHIETTDEVNPRTGKPKRRRVVDRVVTGAYPTILDDTTYNQVLARLSSNGPRKAESGLVWWLSDVATCGECGTGLRTASKDGYTVYRCPPSTSGGCGGVSIKAEPLQQVVTSTIVEAARSGDLVQAVVDTYDTGDTDTDRVALTMELNQLTARRDEARELMVSGDLPIADGSVVVAGIEAKIDQVSASLRDLNVDQVTGTQADLLSRVDTYWDEMTAYERREAAVLVLDRLVVNRAPWTRPSKDVDPIRDRIDLALVIG